MNQELILFLLKVPFKIYDKDHNEGHTFPSANNLMCDNYLSMQIQHYMLRLFGKIETLKHIHIINRC